MGVQDVDTISNVKRHNGLREVPNKTKSKMITSNEARPYKSNAESKDALEVNDKQRIINSKIKSSRHSKIANADGEKIDIENKSKKLISDSNYEEFSGDMVKNKNVSKKNAGKKNII